MSRPHTEEVDLVKLHVPVVHLWVAGDDRDRRPLPAAHDLDAGEKHELGDERPEGGIGP